jgi:hypothetical protein
MAEMVMEPRPEVAMMLFTVFFEELFCKTLGLSCPPGVVDEARADRSW